MILQCDISLSETLGTESCLLSEHHRSLFCTSNGKLPSIRFAVRMMYESLLAQEAFLEPIASRQLKPSPSICFLCHGLWDRNHIQDFNCKSQVCNSGQPMSEVSDIRPSTLSCLTQHSDISDIIIRMNNNSFILCYIISIYLGLLCH